MFSLIITIISIALVAALALATLYYGGSAFNRGSAGATAAQLINEGQQVNGAVTIAKADAAAGGTAVATWADLTTGTTPYLSQLPSGLGLTPGGTIATVTKVLTGAAGADVCTEINKRAGHVAGSFTAEVPQPGVYGCAPSTTTFYFKM